MGRAEGSPEKAALHAVVSGIMAKLGGSDFASGAVGGGLNELLQNELAKISNPIAREWASVAIGAAAAKLVGGNALTGATAAVYGEKYNNLLHFAKNSLKALASLGSAGIRILNKFGFASEAEVLATDANILKFVEQYNIWQARIMGFKNTAYDFAQAGTHNSEATEVVLGKYIPGSAQSYEWIASQRGATYFQFSKEYWNQVAAEFGESNMWLINERFLQQQLASGNKTFILTSNPATANGFFAQEVEVLSTKFNFVQIGESLWQAVPK